MASKTVIRPIKVHALLLTETLKEKQNKISEDFEIERNNNAGYL